MTVLKPCLLYVSFIFIFRNLKKTGKLRWWFLKQVKISPRSVSAPSGKTVKNVKRPGKALAKKTTHHRRRRTADRKKKKRKALYNDDLIWPWKTYDQEYWDRFGYLIGINGTINFRSKMPINGGTRMLRARRKDINIKPNRRLDRKSSRGMLFENEELRMRTITINAEVEQGELIFGKFLWLGCPPCLNLALKC